MNSSKQTINIPSPKFEQYQLVFQIGITQLILQK